jgi:hypothetical protein
VPAASLCEAVRAAADGAFALHGELDAANGERRSEHGDGRDFGPGGAASRHHG